MGFWATSTSGNAGLSATEQARVDSILSRPIGYNPYLGRVDYSYNQNIPVNDGGEGLLSNVDYSGAVTPPPPIQMKTIPQTEGSWKFTTPVVPTQQTLPIALSNYTYNPTGLLSDFGQLNYGLLSPDLVSQLQASSVPTQGQYGQTLPTTQYDPTAKDAKFDPYYNLRNMQGLENNPNFSWLKSFNTQPMNFAPLSLIDPTAYASISSEQQGKTDPVKEAVESAEEQIKELPKQAEQSNLDNPSYFSLTGVPSTGNTPLDFIVNTPAAVINELTPDSVKDKYDQYVSPAVTSNYENPIPVITTGVPSTGNKVIDTIINPTNIFSDLGGLLGSGGGVPFNPESVVFGENSAPVYQLDTGPAQFTPELYKAIESGQVTPRTDGRWVTVADEWGNIQQVFVPYGPEYS